MPYQVDDAVRHAMSGTELSRVQPNSGSFFASISTRDCSRREQPTLLCNHVGPKPSRAGVHGNLWAGTLFCGE